MHQKKTKGKRKHLGMLRFLLWRGGGLSRRHLCTSCRHQGRGCCGTGAAARGRAPRRGRARSVGLDAWSRGKAAGPAPLGSWARCRRRATAPAGLARLRLWRGPRQSGSRCPARWGRLGCGSCPSLLWGAAVARAAAAAAWRRWGGTRGRWKPSLWGRGPRGRGKAPAASSGSGSGKDPWLGGPVNISGQAVALAGIP